MQYKLSNSDNSCSIMDRHCYSASFVIHYADIEMIEKIQREEKKLFSKKIYYYLRIDYVPTGEKHLKTVTIEYTSDEIAIADYVFNYINNFVIDRRKAEELSKKKPFLKKEIICEEIGYELAYSYADVLVVGTDFITNKEVLKTLDIGNKIKIQAEPENTYDSYAIAFYKENDKIGYIKKGTLQDMIHDFIKRNAPILAYINIIDNDGIKLLLGFYKRQLSLEEMKEKMKNSTVKLTGNSNAEMQEAIFLTSEGEQVEAEWDYDKEKFLVVDSCGNNLGCLPSKIASELNESNTYKGFVQEIIDGDKTGVKITLFY